MTLYILNLYPISLLQLVIIAKSFVVVDSLVFSMLVSWTDASAVRNTGCASRGPGFGSQYHIVAHKPSIISVPGEPMPSPHLSGTSPWCIDIYGSLELKLSDLLVCEFSSSESPC